MNDYKMKTNILTPEIKEEMKKMKEWLKEDYADNDFKIGKVKVEHEFETYQAMKCEVLSNGVKRYTPDANGEISYQLVVTFLVPLLCMGFDATDYVQYRWNDRRKMFEHESTEVY